MKNYTDFTTDEQDPEQSEEEEDYDEMKIGCKKHLKQFTPNQNIKEVNKLLNAGERIKKAPIPNKVPARLMV